ncbi:MAG: 2-oxoacid:acceptor oxidoreductase family protein [Patescibacteria group bacterium]|jgi:pyruvate ferredoxin oxidoreductase gamma subunit|nr:2-oxoacid:acceptor oxidoreductase family protein [Patescibacteria group bacterium]
MKNKDKYEIIIYGRGGQGAKTTAEIIAQSALAEGRNVQAFPEFGPERSGAPVKTFVRLSNQEIKTREPIVDPDCVLVLDETLLDVIEVTKNLDNKEPLIINSNKSKKEINQKIGFKGNVIPIDATTISKEIIGENRPNTVILGKFAFVTEKIKVETITGFFRDKYLEKIGKEKTQNNIEAIERAYDYHH